METKQKISQLPNATALTGTEKQVINQSGVTKLATPAQTKTYVLTGGVSGTFTTVDNKTVTVTNGVITSII
jgi:hypothetical protein